MKVSFLRYTTFWPVFERILTRQDLSCMHLQEEEGHRWVLAEWDAGVGLLLGEAVQTVGDGCLLDGQRIGGAGWASAVATVSRHWSRAHPRRATINGYLI